MGSPLTYEAQTPVTNATTKSTPSAATASASASSSDWGGEIREFVPQRFNEFQPSSTPAYDPYSMQSVNNAISDMSDGTSQINPYSQDAQATLFQNTTSFTHTQPLNYHLYAPIGPHRENLMPYQRTAHDFFIPDHLREELQRKTEATAQTFSNSTLPQQPPPPTNGNFVTFSAFAT